MINLNGVNAEGRSWLVRVGQGAGTQAPLATAGGSVQTI